MGSSMHHYNFPVICIKGDNICDILFAFLDIKSHLKGALLFPFIVDPTVGGGKKKLTMHPVIFR